MSTAKKHMERSHRSYHEKKAQLVNYGCKALVAQEQKQARANIFQRLVPVHHRTIFS